jgi:histone-lysine N-methyltransferase NSD2
MTFPIIDRLKIYDTSVELQKKYSNMEELEKSYAENVDDKEIHENLRVIFKTLREHDEKQTEVAPKKRETKAEQPPVVQVEGETEEQLNRRLSHRVITKRKFEDDGSDDHKKEGTPSSSITDDDCHPPSEKKFKSKKDETLEERFLTEIKDIHYLFKNASKNKVCAKCQVKGEGEEQTYRCSAKNCATWLHEACFEVVEKKKEQIRHKTGDSDDIILTEHLISFYTCESCHLNLKKCFVCNQTIEKEEPEIINCTSFDCKQSYHEKCLKFLPKNRKSACPQHGCHTCNAKNINKNGTLAKCVKCVASYHTDIFCIPAGSQVLSRTQIICPRHMTEKEKLLKKKPLNIDWCSVCTKSGSLICCDGCPNAFHSDCLPSKSCESEETFLCDECIEGRMPVYNSIVWAKVGHYRWWPAFVMLPWVVPLQIAKSQKFEREFCIRFFGSSDFYYITCERVFPYDTQNEDIYVAKSGNSRLDSAYYLALAEANDMMKILNAENEKKKDTKPKFYTKVTQNRAVAPVKLRKPGESALEKCECSSNDVSPCGRDSNCINMLLNVECSKSCPAGARCQNQKLRNRENVDLKIVRTMNRGFGAISVNDIPPDTFIVEYVGELIDNNELNRRMEHKIQHKEKEFYFLTIEGDLFVDAEFYANKSRFLNHSCNPNCETRKVIVDGNTRIGIFSNQVIKAVSRT